MEQQKHTQADGRRAQVFTDQHGRHYSGVVEKSTGHPVGALIPVAPPNIARDPVQGPQYDAYAKEHQLWPYAPVMPGDKYVKAQDDNGSGVLVDYDEWDSDLEYLHKAWFQQLTDAARLHYKDQAARVLERIRVGGEDVPVELLNLVGERPLDRRIVKTAQNGQSLWILGLTNPRTGAAMPRPEWADKLFPRPVAKEEEFFVDDEVFADDEWDEPESFEAPEDEQPRRRGGRRKAVAA